MKEPGGSELRWPLVGRAAEVARVTSLLRSGQGAVVLTGPAGVGKTRLGTECLALAGAEGFVPLRVSATQGAAGLPFGAFAHFVPDLGPSADLLQVLRRIAWAVGERGGGRPVAIFVDDAHLLDESSAALTHMLATTEHTFVLATLRSGEPAPEPVVALWKDEVAERLDLRPLDVQEVGELVAAALGGLVDGATVHHLHQRTEGNALFLREVVLGAREAGALRVAEGVWRLSGPLPASSRLVEIIEARLRGLEEPRRHALEVLALGEPLEVQLLRAADQPIELGALEQRGLVRIEQDGRRLRARLPHPLYGEVLRSRLSPLRARSSAAALASALQGLGGRRREDTLRLAVWSLDGGGVLQPDIMMGAATAARQRYDFALAERLARAAIDAGAGFEAALLLAQVCWLQGRGAEALRLLEGLSGTETSDAQRVLLAMSRISVLDWGLKLTEAALQVAEEAEAAIAEPAYRDQISAERARILGRSGRNAAAVKIASPLLGRVSGGALVSACFAAATSMAVTGQFAAGIDATERGHATHLQLTGPPLPFGPYLHVVIRCGMLIRGGRVAEAQALAQEEYDKAVREGSVEAQSFFSFQVATAHLFAGRVGTAARAAAESAGAFRELGWNLWVRNALGVRAHALALLGEAGLAQGVLTEIDSLGVPPSEFLGPELLQARAWVDVATGDVRAAQLRLEEAVEMARWAGASALESSALHDLARLGGVAQAISRSQELTGVVEGALAATRAEHATALASQDPAGLEACSGAFEDCGTLLLAAEAAADAAVAWRHSGEPRRAAAAERRSRGLADRCEGARTPALASTSSVRAALTARELEIARLAAGGLPNKEIAQRLFLSHRTVENQLHTAYEKLGVRGRAELARALEPP